MSFAPMTNGGSLAGVRVVGCQQNPLVSSATNPSGDSEASPQATEISAPLSPQFSIDSPPPSSAKPITQPHRVDAPSPLNVESSPQDQDPAEPVESEPQEPVHFHRIREVRLEQGVSPRSMARRLNMDVRSYKRLEEPTEDLPLSTLHQIQQALDIPLCDLLVQNEGLSRPVEERAKMVKTMKTAVAIREAKGNSRVQRLADMLCEQLVDLMPELKDVGGWPQFGARRGKSALGRALCEPIDMSQLRSDD